MALSPHFLEPSNWGAFILSTYLPIGGIRSTQGSAQGGPLSGRVSIFSDQVKVADLGPELCLIHVCSLQDRETAR